MRSHASCACVEATILPHEIGHAAIGDDGHEDPRWRSEAFWTAMAEALAANVQNDDQCKATLLVPSILYAVMSLARLHDRDTNVFHRRAETEAIHELGHTYGLGHCRDPRCVMWFSNTLAESDLEGTRFCEAHAPS